jgi:TatD DNase family protein
MNLIDTHSHLYLPDFDNDREAVIKRATENNIRKIFLPNIDSSSIVPLLELVNWNPNIFFPMIGLHPTSVKENYEEELKLVESRLAKERFWGIGEVGIDLYWDRTYKIEQTIAFRYQIGLALDHKLPVIIHSRDSINEIFLVLDEFSTNNISGIFHSFTGTVSEAIKAINMGFKIGINGIVTFKNSGLDEVVRKIGLENIVLETDAPYLAPTPKRGKRNESSFLIYIAQKLAELFSTDMESVSRITSDNARDVFGM